MKEWYQLEQPEVAAIVGLMSIPPLLCCSICGDDVCEPGICVCNLCDWRPL